MDIYEYSLNQPDPLLYRAHKFKQIITNLRSFTSTLEFGGLQGNLVIALGYLIEFARNDIIQWLSLFVPKDKRPMLLLLEWMDVSWCKEVALLLFNLHAQDVVYWLFIHVPYYYRSDIGEWRSHYVEMLELLEYIWPQECYFTEKEFLFMTKSACATYSIAYQNCINANVLKRVCKLVRLICPSVNYISQSQSQNIRTTSSTSSKIKVCFVSDSLAGDTSVLRDRMGVILGLDRERFDVYYASTLSKDVIISKAARELYIKNGGNSKYIQLNDSSLTESRSKLEGFDIIVYPEIGMRVFTTYLAYSRIAPIQITTWGHSETSGIDTIDYYISSKLYEVDDARSQTHYSEKLITMDSLSTYYYNPAKLPFIADTTNTSVVNMKTRYDMGFSDDDHLYMCLQSSFKMSVLLEDCIVGIIKRDPHAKILLSNNTIYPRSLVMSLISKLGESIAKDTLIYYPTLSKHMFLNITKMCDVMLDSYPFGGCNSSLEAFSFGIPVVTWPTEFINGRFTLGFYKKMGLSNSPCIVDSMEEYIECAVKLCTDECFRNSVTADIMKNKDCLFEDDDSVNEWNQVLVSLSSCKYDKNQI
jgi:protein O-GlcNAc transferase